MKKIIIIQKPLFIYMNIVSLIFIIISIIGGIFIDIQMLFLLFFSLFFSLLSVLFLINRIEYDDNTIKFIFILKKLEKKYENIKEIFIKDMNYKGRYGCSVVFNFECQTENESISYFNYIKKCKGLDAFCVNGILKKDLLPIISKCNCRIIKQ